MTRISLFITTLVLLASCGNQHVNTSTIGQEEMVKKYFAHFNGHEWTKIAEMYADTVACKDPSLGQGIVLQTRQQIIAKYAELNKIFANLSDSIVQMYPSGEKQIIVEFISKGTAPDNTTFELPICTIFTIENGLITKDFTYFDDFE